MAAEPSDAEIQSAMAVILREGELSQLTSRIVRSQLEDKFGVSFYGRKKEIDKMLMEMIENQEKSTEDEKEQENGSSGINGVEQEESEQEDEESSEDEEPSPKKIKQDTKKETSKADSDSDDDTHDANDAELARKLHENENGLRTRRQTTRKPVERKKPTKTKKPKESSGNKKGFGKLMVLSPALAEVVGGEKMSRSDVVKRMWEIIRERKLEDPKNKRFTLCDEQLQHIFGRKRIQTFGMMKYLKKHIWDPALIV
ncbi:hypothetical protein ACROYT_G004480 [Oculina patagonica]